MIVKLLIIYIHPFQIQKMSLKKYHNSQNASNMPILIKTRNYFVGFFLKKIGQIKYKRE